MATAAVRPMAVMRRSQSKRGPASRRAVMPPAAMARESTASADQVEGDGPLSVPFTCRVSAVSMPLAISCILGRLSVDRRPGPDGKAGHRWRSQHELAHRMYGRLTIRLTYSYVTQK